jgi:HD-GYP domain-containing protein (c-di-GMP phosphodiesterase class II)
LRASVDERLSRVVPQPAIGIGVIGVALLTEAAALSRTVPLAPKAQLSAAVLGLLLPVGVALANKFPLHFRASRKVYMGSVLLYLMAVLLPPALAMAAAGAGLFAGDLLTQRSTGNYVSDMATQAGRWMLLVFAASLLAHVQLAGPALMALPLVAAAAVLWCGDILTLPFLYGPVTGERPLPIMRASIRDAGLLESAQYAVGLAATIDARVQGWTLVLFVLPTVMLYRAFKGTADTSTENRSLIEAIADALEQRGPDAAGHARRVASVTERLLQHLAKSGPDVATTIAAARLHDIGNLFVPDDLLQTRGELASEERRIVEGHAEHGADLLVRFPSLRPFATTIRHHHERWDGAGYPSGLHGESIPFGSRVIALAESFDAMTSPRPYRPALSLDEALEELRSGRGTQWDPVLVDALIDMVIDSDAPQTR